MDTNLVVADASRTEKTICLAVSTSLKSLGISGRARLFEVVQKVREVNTLRKTAVHTGRQEDFVQMDLFTDYEALEKRKQENEARMKKERALQEAVLSVKKKFDKNAILKGINLEEGATDTQRNNQIGGHRA